MTTVAHILGEFIAAWNSGSRPRMRPFLERLPPGADREELADQIEMFLTLAPDPAYASDSWDAMVSDPSVRAAASASMEPEPWPSLLPRLRSRVGLSVGAVAARLGVSKVDKAEKFLGDMESGRLDPSRPSRLLLERLAEILGVPMSALDWRPTSFGVETAAVLRSTAGDADVRLDILADALLTDGSDWDDVDELFLAGRE